MDVNVSVVIATYNRAAMVQEAIAAALGQTAPPDEIVVSDDASIDETSVMLANIDPRVRVFRRERNSGGVDNWNFAMRQARGRFLAWCSDDDRFLPGHLSQSLAYLEAHPEVGMVHSGFVDALERDGRTELVERRLRARGRPLVIDRRNLLGYMTRYYDWPFHPSTLVMRREVWESTGEFDARYALADTDWFVRAVQRFPVALLPVHGVINRRHAGNWSNRVGSARMQKEIHEIVDRAIGSRWWWRVVWRNHVRLRLLLTLRARLRSGHRDAAAAAWRAFANDTGWHAPGWVERSGDALIKRRCAGFADGRGSVSPL
jgi:glycosyltransferase involved in cell wall biosynthesis